MVTRSAIERPNTKLIVVVVLVGAAVVVPRVVPVASVIPVVEESPEKTASSSGLSSLSIWRCSGTPPLDQPNRRREEPLL
jgi:hypothetical protein